MGYTVYVENQNSFRLRGRQATLGGKPDLIAVKNADAVIIDAKTGRASRRPEPRQVGQPVVPIPEVEQGYSKLLSPRVRGTPNLIRRPRVPIRTQSSEKKAQHVKSPHRRWNT